MHVWRGVWSELLKFLRWLWLEKHYRVGLYIPSLLDQLLVIKLGNIKFYYNIGVSKRGSDKMKVITLVESKWQERQNDEGYRENGREIVGLYPPEQQGTQASDVGPHSLWLTYQFNEINSSSIQTLTASRTSFTAFIKLYNTEQQTRLPLIFIFFFLLRLCFL